MNDTVLKNTLFIFIQNRAQDYSEHDYQSQVYLYKICFQWFSFFFSYIYTNASSMKLMLCIYRHNFNKTTVHYLNLIQCRLQNVDLMVCLHCVPPSPIKNGLYMYRLMWRCSYCSETDTNTDSHCVLHAFYRYLCRSRCQAVWTHHYIDNKCEA